MTAKIILGRLGSPYGVKGWLRVTSYTDPEDNLFQYPNWQIQHQREWQAIKLEAQKPHGKSFIIKLQGIDTPEQAKLYTQDFIAIERQDLPKTEENEYYWDDLTGLQVITTTGIKLGEIDYLFETGSNDVLVIKGDKERWLPYTDDVIKEINLKDKQMTVDWDPDF